MDSFRGKRAGVVGAALSRARLQLRGRLQPGSAQDYSRRLPAFSPRLISTFSMRGFLPPTTVGFSTCFAFLITAGSEVVMAEQKWVKFRAVLDGVLDGKIDVAHLVGSSKPSPLFQKRAPKVSHRNQYRQRGFGRFHHRRDFYRGPDRRSFHHHATACTGLDCRFTSRKFPPTWIRSLMSFMSPITPAGKSTSRSRSKPCANFSIRISRPKMNTSERFAESLH